MAYRNILLIDDDVDEHEIFQKALEKISSLGVFVGLTSANVALQELASRKIITDVIFLDLNMPVMGGIEFLKEIKQIEELNKIPIIIYSTTSHSGTIQETKHLGAHDFITKPDKLDDLVNILQSLEI